MNAQDEEPQRTIHRRWLGPLLRPIGHFRRTLGAGILVILPIGITILVLKFFFDLLDPLLDPAVDLLPGPDIPGLGLLALALLVYLGGLIAAHVVGRRVIDVADRVMEFIPVVKSIYGTTRSAVEMLSSGNGRRYSGVVLIDFPRVGVRSIGLVTSRMLDTKGEEMLAVYIPGTPIPTSGFLVIVPAAEVTPTDMSVEDAMKIVISGGIHSKKVLQHIVLTSREETPRSSQ